MSEPVDQPERIMVMWYWSEAWLQSVTPASLTHLHHGATEQQLQVVETALGLPLPTDLKTPWLHHNGTAKFFFGSWGFLSVEQLLDACRAERVFEDWSPAYIPFASSCASGSLCVDLDASKGESMGRIVFLDHESGGQVDCSQFLASVNDLEDGKYEGDTPGRRVSEDVSLVYYTKLASRVRSLAAQCKHTCILCERNLVSGMFLASLFFPGSWHQVQ